MVSIVHCSTIIATHLLEAFAKLLASRLDDKVSVGSGHQAEELEQGLLHSTRVCENNLHEALKGMTLLVVPCDLTNGSQECGRNLSEVHGKGVCTPYPQTTKCDRGVLVERFGNLAVKEDCANLLE